MLIVARHRAYVLDRGATKFEVLQHDLGVPLHDFEVSNQMLYRSSPTSHLENLQTLYKCDFSVHLMLG